MACFIQFNSIRRYIHPPQRAVNICMRGRTAAARVMIALCRSHAHTQLNSLIALRATVHCRHVDVMFVCVGEWYIRVQK